MEILEQCRTSLHIHAMISISVKPEVKSLQLCVENIHVDGTSKKALQSMKAKRSFGIHLLNTTRALIILSESNHSMQLK